MRVLSNNTVFDIDDVTVDLSIGIHYLNMFGIPDDNPVEQYHIIWFSEAEEIRFGVYMCNDDYADYFYNNTYTTSNIENIPHHTFVKSITLEDAFSKKYGYGSVYSNHIESITIPKDIFEEEQDAFIIRLVILFYRDGIWTILDSGIYDTTVEYKKVDDSTIEITNFYNTFN